MITQELRRKTSTCAPHLARLAGPWGESLSTVTVPMAIWAPTCIWAQGGFESAPYECFFNYLEKIMKWKIEFCGLYYRPWSQKDDRRIQINVILSPPG
jgi:hypothetical protein